ncbi:MAG: class I SAM-dependent methyltransferase [bacterium]
MTNEFNDAVKANRKTIRNMIWKNPKKAWLTIFAKKAHTLYTNMGEADDPKYKDLSTPLWLNFGYWQNAYTYDDACEALATKLGEYLELDATDGLLDVGFGFGEQDILWKKKFNVSSIKGINITPLHVEVAKMRVAMHGLQDSVDLQLGDATRIPYKDESFTKVSALECAFHFDTRRDFLKEAYRVLKPGGKLGLTDCFPGKERNRDFYYWFVLKAMSIPYGNMVDEHTYIKELEEIGFKNVQINRITDKVFTGMASYFKKLASGIPKEEVKVNIGSDQVRIEDWWSGRGWFMGLDEYALVTATKPQK